MTNTDKLTARIAAMTDNQIEDALQALDATAKTSEERMVYAALADALSARWDIEPELDRVFLDEEFTGSYYEAMLIARENRHRL